MGKGCVHLFHSEEQRHSQQQQQQQPPQEKHALAEKGLLSRLQYFAHGIGGGGGGGGGGGSTGHCLGFFFF